jgi:hypothetical protein
MYFLPGAADQVLPDVLAQRLGRANGADAPGYRGLASLFFIGDKPPRLLLDGEQPLSARRLGDRATRADRPQSRPTR